MKQVSPAMIESVQPMPTVGQNSTHSTEMKTYCVDFGTKKNFLRCSCSWFRRKLSLCKRFFAVIDSGYREFEDLTTLYRNHSLHTINTNLFQFENDDTPLVKNIVSTFDYYLHFYKL